MWLICEAAGVVCAILTYVIVLTVQVGMIRVGIWEGLMNGEPMAFLHLIVFQYHCAMIFWSHFKCMTTEPGVLPKNYDTLSFKKIAPEMAEAIIKVKKEVEGCAKQHAERKQQLLVLEQKVKEQVQRNVYEMSEEEVKRSKCQLIVLECY